MKDCAIAGLRVDATRAAEDRARATYRNLVRQYIGEGRSSRKRIEVAFLEYDQAREAFMLAERMYREAAFAAAGAVR
jgi:hypothetical protein